MNWPEVFSRTGTTAEQKRTKIDLHYTWAHSDHWIFRVILYIVLKISAGEGAFTVWGLLLSLIMQRQKWDISSVNHSGLRELSINVN